ncbi:E3 SUMO-protein ligase PIAS2 isoform X8 [Papio anubis]|uniref:E3 SUMO-protein ligase PIAS2 isoform X8 n=1 Tax=Papio anubis TaxID=9555 RepID=UPI0012ADB400|nr:E3 SUMO-protein ligase PIAS2 isoform X8 [Papio anubis]
MYWSGLKSSSISFSRPYIRMNIFFICSVQSSIQRFQEKFFIFALTPQQVREICISRDFLPGGRRDYTVQVQLRLCLAETSCPQEDNYPNSLCIKVNGKLFPLPGYAPPPKNGIEQKRPGRPLNITSLVRLSSAVPNQISISWASEIGKNYSMSVYLVRQLTSAMLLQRLKMKGIRNPDHSRALIKEKLTADPDSEIATTSLRVSLMCPLGKMRLTIPCRAVTCTHLQCFDAALYLQMNEKKPTWICPVCDKKAAYESLILDGLFMEILNDCSDVDEIKFQEDGSWCPMRPKKEAMKVSSQPCTKIESSSVLSKPCSVTVASEASKKKVDVIDLTIESSSDEEEDPPAKRKCIFMSETQSSPTKGVLMYQPSSVRVPSVTSVDPAAIPPSLTDYSVPFHHTPISSMSSDLPASKQQLGVAMEVSSRQGDMRGWHRMKRLRRRRIDCRGTPFCSSSCFLVVLSGMWTSWQELKQPSWTTRQGAKNGQTVREEEQGFLRHTESLCYLWANHLWISLREK